MVSRSTLLELGVLALACQPIHGYQIRRDLAAMSVSFTTLTLSSLYPLLHRLANDGLLAAEDAPDTFSKNRKTYVTTPAGLDYVTKRPPNLPPENLTFGLQMRFFDLFPPDSQKQLLIKRHQLLLTRKEKDPQKSKEIPPRPPHLVASYSQLLTQQLNLELKWLTQAITNL